MWVGAHMPLKFKIKLIFKGIPKVEVTSGDWDWHAPKNNVMKFHCPANRCDAWTKAELWEVPSIWTDSLGTEFCLIFFSYRFITFCCPEYQKKTLKVVETINLIAKSQRDINQAISSVQGYHHMKNLCYYECN